jgi:hypothetical protein
MATVKKITPKNPPPPAYTIELTEQEAMGLSTLLTCGVAGRTLDALMLNDLQIKLWELCGIGHLSSDDFEANATLKGR